MQQYFTYICAEWWRLLIIVLFLLGILTFILKGFALILASVNIWRKGYPPENCDTNGDFKPLEENE